jgi:tRNA(Arg) A34 adenosine deaminase TadA
LGSPHVALPLLDPQVARELDVVRAASREFDFATPEGATLYSATEPCAMCSGAICWSGIGRVVYALGAETMMTFVNDVSGSATFGASLS